MGQMEAYPPVQDLLEVIYRGDSSHGCNESLATSRDLRFSASAGIDRVVLEWVRCRCATSITLVQRNQDFLNYGEPQP